uniref:Phycobilisome rod-core linker polypeptide CpcG2 (Lrc) n=1 Tax=uncultured Synechococcus sp. TaxID=154535 RepID=A0A024CHX2_9SYNE|nr:phycobilisome rod-core linker polypeptide CpcG2 (Lrc) [uncultured Synechococcus sp.]
MAVPLQAYPLTTQNARVSNLAGDTSTVRTELTGSSKGGADAYRSNIDNLIEQAYQQIFFHAMQSDREPYLESQLRSGNITLRDFIRGLLLSERFQQGYYQCSSNYRMVDQVVGRVLGRPVHGEAERLAWSIVIGEKGFTTFVDTLLDSDEYMSSFGYDLVPQQRSRVLPGQSLGDTPIYQSFPRYGADWRDSLQERAPSAQFDGMQGQTLQVSELWVNGQPPAWLLKVWLGLFVVGGFEITRVLLTIAISMVRS